MDCILLWFFCLGVGDCCWDGKVVIEFYKIVIKFYVKFGYYSINLVLIIDLIEVKMIVFFSSRGRR